MAHLLFYYFYIVANEPGLEYCGSTHVSSPEGCVFIWVHLLKNRSVDQYKLCPVNLKTFDTGWNGSFATF